MILKGPLRKFKATRKEAHNVRGPGDLRVRPVPTKTLEEMMSDIKIKLKTVAPFKTNREDKYYVLYERVSNGELRLIPSMCNFTRTQVVEEAEEEFRNPWHKLKNRYGIAVLIWQDTEINSGKD